MAYHNALEVARRGHEVHVFTGGSAVAPGDEPSGVIVHRLPTAFQVGNAPLLKGLGRELDGLDLVHLHYPFYFGGEQVWWRCRRKAIPYVLTYQMDVHWPGVLGIAPELHHRALGSRVVAGARLIGVSTLDYAAHSRLADLPPERLVEVPNGVDTRVFRPDVDVRALRSRYQLEAGAPVVLFVGALDRAHYFKGVPNLLAALANVPKATLLIVGDGDRRAAYQHQAKATGLGDRVRFLGRVSPEELPLHYALADVAVLPSINRMEAFGLVLVEAMASGTPVIASRLPGVRTVVDDGTTGLLAEPGDAEDLAAKMRAILDDPILRARMGAAGRRRAEERYDWRRIGALLEGIYRDVLRPKAMPRSAQVRSESRSDVEERVWA